MQKHFDLIGRHSGYSRLSVNQSFIHHVNSNFNGSVSSPLSGSCLKNEELAVFYRELNVLHVGVSLFEVAGDCAELLVDFRHFLRKFSDWHWRSDSCNNVLALCVNQELAVKLILTCRRVTGEADTSSAVIAEIPECHCYDVDGSSERVVNFIDFTVRDCSGNIPALEDRLDCAS